jgi:hypothetical protein
MTVNQETKAKMSDVRDVQRLFCSRALAAAIVIALIFLFAGAKPIARGLILGTLFSVLNFVLIAHSLPMQINKGQRKTFLTCIGGIGCRYLLLSIPLFIAARMENFDFFATAAGIFMVQGVLIVHHIGKLLWDRE